ncbi:MAG: hypothetical protein QT03_C0001G1344 [archaeon GW2011_AR10]|uniref:Uncharacterized protein n=1 Tax=Candidatus Iainarchaeum sp. TaxID=3101447 RepID=A0A7J4ITS3_9ARCH|nr:MAG: hypothetical protein QT03_C0001G1344 [archaeon GW2011_AR10]HIH08901.1 hypothetical protein [Candidatus Diapherotrites archaeon]
MVRQETKLKCIRCGYFIVLDSPRAKEVSCPKCSQQWKLIKEEDELFLEPIETITEKSP